MSDQIRWGILGTGKIAHAFVEGLAALPDAALVAVGSRGAASAQAFADQYHIPHRHATYAELAYDPDVDVIYIATPHAVHLENMELCLNAGKPVLCEKPFTLNASLAATAVRLARTKGLFLMEAMWTRYIPLVVRIRQMLAEGAIGEPRLLIAGLATFPDPDPARYFFKPELGGGILLDAGVYPISLAYYFFGPPARVASVAQMGETGVDVQDAVILDYTDGRLCNFYFSFRTRLAPFFALYGSAGRITVDPPMFRPTRLVLSRDGKPEEEMVLPLDGNGFNYEAAEVMHCLREGRCESTIMPLDETVAILRTADELRAQWGLRFPMERV